MKTIDKVIQTLYPTADESSIGFIKGILLMLTMLIVVGLITKASQL